MQILTTSKPGRALTGLSLLLILFGVVVRPAFSQAKTAQPQPKANLTLAELHSHMDDLALRSQKGDLNATAELSQTIFERVGIPPTVASVFGYTQRVAQAEYDYRNGNQQQPVHEADLVAAHNNFVHAIGMQAWATTNQSEVRHLRMDFMVRYPQLLAKHGPPDKNGKYQALDDNISPAEATFLATSLLYQKLFNHEYQMTVSERAAGGESKVSAAVFNERTQTMFRTLHGLTDEIGVFELAHAADGLFNDLHIGSNLRSEFKTLPVSITQTTVIGGRK